MIFLLEEKTCRAEMFCTEQQHSMAEAGGEKFPLVFAFVGEYTQKLHDSLKEAVMPQIEAGKVRPFVLALYGPIEWDAVIHRGMPRHCRGVNLPGMHRSILILYNTGYCRI